MDWNKLNPEINVGNKHIKIGLASLFGILLSLAIDPSSLVVFGLSAPVAGVISKAVLGAVTAGTLYNMDPNKKSDSSEPPAQEQPKP